MSANEKEEGGYSHETIFLSFKPKIDLSHELPLNDRNKEKLGYTQFPNEDGMLCDCDATHNNNNNIGVCLFVELFSRKR